MRSKARSVFLTPPMLLMALVGAGALPVAVWSAPAALADADLDADSGASSDGPDAAEPDADFDDGPDFDPGPQQQYGPPGGIPMGPQIGGMPPLPLMPGYPGGSPFDGGQGMPPLPFTPGYPGGSPFGGPPPPQ